MASPTRFKFPPARREIPGVPAGIAVAVLCVLGALPARAADRWESVAGDLGRDASRYAIYIGGSYGTMEGSEVNEVKPSRGFDVGASYRIFGSVAVVGSYALDRGDVDGQLVQLLDQKVRADGRSGLVRGQVQVSRARAGLRWSAYREQGWRLSPYLLGAVVFSQIEVTIDSVDGKPPVPVPTGGAGSAAVDISRIQDDQIGGLARAGIEARVTGMVSVDVSGNVEIIETQPGTNTLFAVTTGLVLRF